MLPRELPAMLLLAVTVNVNSEDFYGGREERLEGCVLGAMRLFWAAIRVTVVCYISYVLA